jgi:phosphoglycerate dehydrogenase-like enzyme
VSLNGAERRAATSRVDLDPNGAPRNMSEKPIYVGMMYGHKWDARPHEALERDFELLRGIDPRIEIIDVEYREPHDLCTARGKVPFDESLRSLAPELTDEQRLMFAHIEVAVANDLPFDVRELAPNLKWVQGMGAGVSQLESAGLAEAGIRLTSAAGINAVGIAEFVIGRVLQHWKRFRELDEFQYETRAWNLGELLGTELAGATVGLVGLGAINSAVAQRLSAFDVRVLATRRHWQPGATAPFVDEVYPSDRLVDVLPECDIVIAAVPESPSTIDIMDEAAFAAMKRGSYFCNVGRGSFVVEEALIGALQSGHLWAAAIDVTREEPLPADSPLWDIPNLYLSPHVATSGGIFFARLQALFRENMARYLKGDELVNEIRFAEGR